MPEGITEITYSHLLHDTCKRGLQINTSCDTIFSYITFTMFPNVHLRLHSHHLMTPETM